MNLVAVYDDQVVHTVAPVGVFEPVDVDPDGLVGIVADLTTEQRIDLISRQDAWFPPRTATRGDSRPEVERQRVR